MTINPFTASTLVFMALISSVCSVSTASVVPLLEIRFEVDDVGGNSIDSIGPGGVFVLKTIVTDLRTTGALGAFGAKLNYYRLKPVGWRRSRATD